MSKWRVEEPGYPGAASVPDDDWSKFVPVPVDQQKGWTGLKVFTALAMRVPGPKYHTIASISAGGDHDRFHAADAAVASMGYCVAAPGLLKMITTANVDWEAARLPRFQAAGIRTPE